MGTKVDQPGVAPSLWSAHEVNDSNVRCKVRRLDAMRDYREQHPGGVEVEKPGERRFEPMTAEQDKRATFREVVREFELEDIRHRENNPF